MPLTAMVLNSDVSEEEDWHGDSTEIALVDYALTKNKQELGKKSKNSRISIRFVKKMHDNNTSNRKGILVITKGAVEVLLDKIVNIKSHLFLHLNEKTK
jgi:Ca2+-transporting ATPase